MMYALMHLYLSIQFVNIDDIFELIAELFRDLKMFPFIRTPLGQTSLYDFIQNKYSPEVHSLEFNVCLNVF